MADGCEYSERCPVMKTVRGLAKLTGSDYVALLSSVNTLEYQFCQDKSSHKNCPQHIEYEEEDKKRAELLSIFKKFRDDFKEIKERLNRIP